MNPFAAILIFLLRVYRWTLSPLLQAVCGPLSGCRFTPSCSVYAMEAIRVHGAWRGGWLALKRLGRCHPWGPCGSDPVPPKSSPRPDRVVQAESTPAHSFATPRA